MAAKFFAILAFAVAASALPVVPVTKIAYAEPEAPAHYEFQYSVHNEETGDIKQQHEARAGDVVQGSYSLVQPDGVHRIVDYTADNDHGFNAIVRYEGHPIPASAYATPITKVAYSAPIAKVAYSAPIAKIAYSAPIAKVAYPAPIAKVAYSAPIAKVAYSAPIAKVAYSAPIAKVAYSAPLAQVTFSSPAINYHH